MGAVRAGRPARGTEPAQADRLPIVLDPDDSDLADFLALARAIRSDNIAAMAFLLTHGNLGCMLITAAKVIAALSLDAAALDPREMAEHALAEAEQARPGRLRPAGQVRRFDVQFSAYAAEILAR